MIRCNVTVCGVVGRVASQRMSKEGKPFVTFTVNVVVPAKNGINKTIEISVLKDGELAGLSNVAVGSHIEVAGTLSPKKRGESLYFNLNATGINADTTATNDGIVGQMEFRGKVGKSIEDRQSKNGEPYQVFSAYSAEKVQDGFEYVWVRFLRFGKEREAWLQPGCRIVAKGAMELSVYKDRISFSCKAEELGEYVPLPYNPNA